MITFSKLDSVILQAGKRVLKVLQFGPKTASESLPFGIDSSPIKGMTAIYGNTSNNGDTVILGYIQKNQLAGEGETRLFSVDSSGSLKSFVWLKNNGTIELNGDQYTAVRYDALNQGLQNQINLLNAELIKVQTGLIAVGGAYARVNVTLDISQSESNTVKIK